MKVLLVTNFAPHYRAPFFERLAQAVDVQFIFTSHGTESYWQPHLGTRDAAVIADTLIGRQLPGGVRVNDGLIRELWRRDYDVLIKCVNGRFELASAYTVAQARRKPFVFWATMWWQPATLLGWASYPALRRIYLGADAIVTDGDHIRRYIAGQGAAPDKIFVAELATDNDAFIQAEAGGSTELRERLGAKDRPLILAVGRLVPVKGLDVLLRAVARLDDLRPVVAVVGTGPLGPALEAMARGLRVDLRLVGGVDPAAMPAYYDAADVCVLPSVTTPEVREVWGLAVNEAFCRSAPVITSDAVGAAAGGLVVHRETGLVVPERSVGALADALRLLLTDRELAGHLAAAGHERVKATNYDAMVDAFVAAAEFAVQARQERAR